MRRIGQRYEALAERYLRQQGLSPIEQNFNGPRGEIDLIMQDVDSLVFVEVRYRASGHYGDAHESVDHHKQQRIIHTARYFLMKYPRLALDPCRFDVISMTGRWRPRIHWLKAAFEATA